MNGMLTPRQLAVIESNDYEYYEYLIARHMWQVIRRKALKTPDYKSLSISDIKHSLATKYNVTWRGACWICERANEFCQNCLLQSCAAGSAYDYANGYNYTCRLKGIDIIISAIDEEWELFCKENNRSTNYIGGIK